MIRQIIGAKNIPKEETEINGVRFREDARSNKLEVFVNEKRLSIDITNDGKLQPVHVNRIMSVQILPIEENFKLFFGADAYKEKHEENEMKVKSIFCSYDLNVNESSYNLEKIVELPFYIHGLLADRNGNCITYGAGGDYGSGIRYLDLAQNKSIDLFPEKYQQSHPLSYAFYCLFFNPPQIEDNKLYISHFDNKGKLFSNNAYNSFMCDWIIGDLVNKGDKTLDEAFQVCIDDKMDNFKSELTSIKKDIANSSFLYFYEKQPWQQIVIVSEDVASYLKKKHGI